MYLTAHLVSSSTQQRGINAFLHLHGDTPLTEVSEELIRTTAEQKPGTLADRDCAVLPLGGNSVHAYLDVVAPDPTPPDNIEASLAQYRAQLERKPGQLIGARVITGVGIRFSTEVGLTGSELPEFDALRTQLLKLLAKQQV